MAINEKTVSDIEGNVISIEDKVEAQQALSHAVAGHTGGNPRLRRKLAQTK